MSKQTEYYGSVKGVPFDTLKQKLAESRKCLEEYSAEMSRRSRFTEVERLADRLHRLLHTCTDCDYHYSDWPNPTGCRSEFHNTALSIIKRIGETNLEDYKHTISTLERLRFGKAEE